MSNWMLGTWTGIGTQDSQVSWAMQLTVRPQGTRDSYRIDYPSLDCGGYWTLDSMGADEMTFTEHIVYGRDRCADLGTMTVNPVRDAPGSAEVAHLAWRWSGTVQGGAVSHASAVLNRQPS
jgi:hypothetical protein